jgi:hypothetical protein
MKNLISIVFFILPYYGWSQDKASFDLYFENQTLRIDYYHTGDANSEIITLDKIYKQGSWAGNPANCIQPFDLGVYNVKIVDSATHCLLFSKGYNSIFAEYQTIEAAVKGVKHTYHESVLIPCPRKSFSLVIEKRDRYNRLSEIFVQQLDPADYHIITENYVSADNIAVPVVISGNPHNKIDLVILAEGYRQEEADTFKRDLKYFANLLFTAEPFKSYANKFNIQGIFSPSEESGSDEPRQGLYKNTKLNSSFNIFDIDRYCLAEDNKSIRDMAAGVPYDIILIMINQNRYGGGGIYNWQCVFTTGSVLRDYVFLHEFGHAFAGLADEYYTSSVAYTDFYTPGIEPLEANLTSLPDTANVKWKQYLTPGIKVPTEWGKAIFDSLATRQILLNQEMEKTLDLLKKSGSTEQNLEKIRTDYRNKIFQVHLEQRSFITNHPLKGMVGVFEGANYMPTGMYRPTVFSLMHQYDESRISYDLVNEQAIRSIIHYFTGE